MKIISTKICANASLVTVSNNRLSINKIITRFSLGNKEITFNRWAMNNAASFDTYLFLFEV